MKQKINYYRKGIPFGGKKGKNKNKNPSHFKKKQEKKRKKIPQQDKRF